MNPSPALPRLAPIDRSQFITRTVDVERLIDEDHSARSIWEVVGRLDLSLYHPEIAAVEGHVGRDHTAPRLLISLWLYAYSETASVQLRHSRFPFSKLSLRRKVSRRSGHWYYGEIAV